MAVWVLLDGTGTEVVEVLAGNPGGGLLVVDVTSVNPQPAVGWTTADGGKTWTAPGPTSALGNLAALIAKADAATDNNVTFLTNAASVTYPLSTAEQTALVNQVMALTRQMDALIDLVTQRLGSTSGT